MMELFLVLLIAFILLKPQEVQQLATGLGKLWRMKNQWQERAHTAIRSLENMDSRVRGNDD